MVSQAINHRNSEFICALSDSSRVFRIIILIESIKYIKFCHIRSLHFKIVCLCRRGVFCVKLIYFSLHNFSLSFLSPTLTNPAPIILATLKARPIPFLIHLSLARIPLSLIFSHFPIYLLAVLSLYSVSNSLIYCLMSLIPLLKII